MPTLEMYQQTVAAKRAGLSEKDVRFVVDAGRRPTPCKGCGTECYWGMSAAKKPLLIDCDVPGGAAPTRSHTGLGAAHYATCPVGDQFRKSNRQDRGPDLARHEA